MNKEPAKSEKFRINAKFTKNARSAWGEIIGKAAKGEKKKVLLPAYIGYTEREGSGVFDPVESHDANFCFYKLNDSLSPDLNDLEEKLTCDIDIVLVIHYFGFCRTDPFLIKEMCKKNKIVMVEDCAHAFYLEGNPLKIGEVGDYSFYSIHKYLPTQTGGLLRINNASESISIAQHSSIVDFAVVEEFALTDFSKIADTRRENYRRYEEKLATVNGISTLYKLNDYEIPQSFPIIVGAGLREKLYFHLMERDMPTTALYYRLIDQIKISEHPKSHLISQSILNLPVHQDVVQNDVDCLCSEISKFMRNFV